VDNAQQETPLESLNVQALQQRALELWEVDQASALELGRALIAVRDAMREERGAFAKWYRENGLEENRVYYCIRRAEGKTATPAPAPVTVQLNRHNLMLTKYAPEEGMFTRDAVQVGPDGTTVTDGFVTLRVGLPLCEGSTCTESVAVPSAFMANLTGPAELSVERDSVSVTTDQITQTAKIQNNFPPIEKAVDANPPCQDKVPETGVSFELSAHRLHQLLEALTAMAEDARLAAPAKISVRPGTLRVDFRRQDGQTFLALMLL
jgi:hypothetical protein